MKKRTKLTVCAAALIVGSLFAKGMQSKGQAADHRDLSDADKVQTASPSVTGALHVEGTQLCGSDGKPVQLRGISTHGIGWFPDYINEECFAQFRNEWNANLIRLAMYTAENAGYCTDGDKEYLKSLVRRGVECATQNDMYVIIDWHILSDNNPNDHVEEAKAFFEEMSSAYADADNVIYEICNEPNGSASWQDVKDYAGQIIPVIRSHEKDAVIIVGTPNWCQFVDQAAADPITGYDNLMYALHFYAATHKEDLRARMGAAVDAGLPVFVSEYGICDASGNGALDIEQANAWVDAMNARGISYAMWNLSNKDESSSILKASCTKTSGFETEDLNPGGQWLRGMLKGELPDPEQIREAEKEVSGALTLMQDGIEITAVVKNSWEAEGQKVYQYDLTLKNTGASDVEQWAVDLTFDGAVKLSDGWNGDYTADGTSLHITSKDYNGKIPAGGSVIDIGFIVSGGTISM